MFTFWSRDHLRTYSFFENGAGLKNQITIILFKIWPTNRFSKAKSYNFHFHKNGVTCLLVQMAYFQSETKTEPDLRSQSQQYSVGITSNAFDNFLHVQTEDLYTRKTQQTEKSGEDFVNSASGEIRGWINYGMLISMNGVLLNRVWE